MKTNKKQVKYHQIPPKYNIYLVGLPSVFFERPGQNEKSVLNQLFLLLFRCFSVLFMKSVASHMKIATFHEKQIKPGQYVCIHAPFSHKCTTCTTKNRCEHICTTCTTFPVYSMKDQVKMRDLCWISLFCCFQCFLWKAPSKTYVCIHAPPNM